MKYKTKPKDYTGCNPVIADHLRRGLSIYCEVWGTHRDENHRQFITDYKPDGEYPYKTTKKMYVHAEPVQIEKKIMAPGRAFPILFAAGYHFDEDGYLVDAEGNDTLYPCNFHFFDKSLTGAPPWFENHPEILEELP